MKEHKELGLVIPCYNEEDVLCNNFNKIKEVLDKTSIKYEIIFVDDHSKDKTVELAQKIVKENPNVKLLRHNFNMGRGRTVEDGIKASTADIVGFIDIDLQIPAHYIVPMVIEIQKGADMATALRIYDIKLHMLHRFILSKGYHFLFDMLLKSGIKDSETGYKFFRREKILKVIDEIKDKHWFWDTEVMVRARLKGQKIEEIPCLCMREERQKSTVNIFRDVVRYIINLSWFKKEVDSIRRQDSKKQKKKPAHNVLYRILDYPPVFDVFLKTFGDRTNLKNIIESELPLSKNKRVLDIGCGTGDLSAMFSSENYIGIDLDEKYINFARHKYDRNFTTMDASSMKFEDNYFDIIFVSGLFHHLHDKLLQKVLDEIKRVVKPTGKILVYEPSFRKNKDNFFKRFVRYIDRGKHIREFNIMQDMLKQVFSEEKSFIDKGILCENSVFIVKKG